jgi:hypothetical protein
MPLGQTPFGTRSPPTPDPSEPPPPPQGIRGGPFSRFSGLIWFLLAGLMVASLFTMRRGEKKPVSDTTQCLTERACGPGWRCFAEPKGDGFAVTGVCSQVCESDLQCATHFRCDEVAVSGDQVVPVGAHGAGPDRAHVCRPCGGACEPR